MPTVTLVDTLNGLIAALRDIQAAKEAHDLQPSSPLLYIDLEGVELCRLGTLSLIQIYLPILRRTFVIDVTVLGTQAFSTSIELAYLDTSAQVSGDEDDELADAGAGFSLRDILESPSIVKCFYDVRNDADALYNLFGVSMSGVVDLQLLENATRRGPKKFLNGLARAITDDADLPASAVRRWTAVKNKGVPSFCSFFRSIYLLSCVCSAF